jgi:methyl-accepting chemotaxis protein
MSFSAGSIFSTLGLDISNFESGFLQSQALMETMPSAVSSFMASPLLGLVNIAETAMEGVIAAIREGISVVNEMGEKFDHLGETAQRAGVSVEFLTGVGAAAKDAGSSVEGVADAMKFLNNNAADAATGSETAAAAFAQIGVSVTDGAGKLRSGESIFYDVADAIARIEDPAKRTQAAMNLMGRGGTELIPVMLGGAAGVKEMADRMTEFGGKVDDKAAAAGDAFARLKGIGVNALEGLAEAFAMPSLEFFQKNEERILEFLREVVPGAKDAASAVGGVLASAFDLALTTMEHWAPIINATTTLLSGFAEVI